MSDEKLCANCGQPFAAHRNLQTNVFICPTALFSETPANERELTDEEMSGKVE